jgi:predicted AlkP superfamily phosphohydrolase/phosphomutase
VGQRIVWKDTKAFSSHVAEQGIHINSRSDLPEGALDDESVGVAEAELLSRLSELKDPADGKHVVDTVVRRADAIHGPHAGRAPHLFPFCRDQRYELSDSLLASAPFTDHRDRPWGYHHKDGILVAAGPGVAEGEVEAGLDIVDVLPTIFHLAGLPVPAGLDGEVNDPLISGEAASRPVETTDLRLDQSQSGDNPYSPEEEQSIEDALRGLGYMD